VLAKLRAGVNNKRKHDIILKNKYALHECVIICHKIIRDVANYIVWQCCNDAFLLDLNDKRSLSSGNSDSSVWTNFVSIGSGGCTENLRFRSENVERGSPVQNKALNKPCAVYILSLVYPLVIRVKGHRTDCTNCTEC
jgi:hypothetical protein